MLDTAHYRGRRRQFLDRLTNPVLLFAGGEQARNYPANPYPYRADSNFLLFFGRAEPGSAAAFDPASGLVTLFLPPRTVEAATWEGPRPSFDEVRDAAGVDRVFPLEALREEAQGLASGRALHSLAVADPSATVLARELTNLELVFEDPERIGPETLVDNLADLRLRKTPAELQAVRQAAAVTAEGFAEVLAATRPGATEQELAGRIEGRFLRAGCVAAYGTTLTPRGEILHKHHRDGVFRAGDMLLCDAGAEVPSGWSADVTRSWPVSGRTTREQAELHDLVLRAEEAAIAAVRPGIRNQEVHHAAARVLAEGLAGMGLLHGAADDLVASGAYALFLPHGIGHLLGLDTHDLRVFGDRITYGADRPRSRRFGENMLRFNRDFQPGMVLTIEPGIYFVAAILRNPEFHQRFAGQADFARAERFLAMNDGRGFGGIRIEDDVHVTETGAEVLTAAIPKHRDALEPLIGKEAPLHAE